MDNSLNHNDLFKKLSEAHNLNAILLDSIPHPALLIRKNREVIAANKLALEVGAVIGGLCWKDYGHCLYVNREDRESVELGTSDNIIVSCDFCNADLSLEKNKTINIKKQLGDMFWDIYWVPTKEEGIYLHYAIDITEQIRIQKELEESSKRFKQLTEVSFEGICIHINGIILDCNTRMVSIFEYGIDELIGMSIFNLIPLDPGKNGVIMDNADQVNLGKFFAVKKGGTSFEIEILSRELMFDGQLVNVLAIRDNSQLRTIEESIIRTQNTLKEAEFIGHIGNIEVDVPKKYVYWSDEVFRIFGYKPQEFIPKYNDYAIHVSDTDRKFIDNQLAKRTPSNPSFFFVCKYQNINGNHGWMDIKVNMEFDEAGEPIKYYIMIQDITDKKQWENDRKESELNTKLLKKTLEMDRLKTEFLANVSHELRTPLNVIYTTLQLFEIYIKNNIIKDSEEKIYKRLRSMRQNCYRLLRLINNLIEINKVDCGFTSLHRENIDIVGFIEEICSSIEEFMEDKKIDFKFESNVKSKVIYCDCDKMETIILNLISNAVKFNKPKGRVTVSLQDVGESILIVVEDTGIGIPKNVQEKIFERFEQVNKSLTRSYEGSGIGLSLSKSFIEMHGGSICVESEYAKGSKFYISLPYKSNFADNVNVSSFKKDMSYLPERISIELSDINN